MDDPGFFDGAFNVFPYVFGLVLVLVVASWIFKAYAVTKNWQKTSDAGIDPITLPADLAIAALGSTARTPPDSATAPAVPVEKSVVVRLAEADALWQSGSITQAEHDAARARILGEL